MTSIEATNLVQQFEDCRLPKEEWTHEAHFVMAFWYCSHQPLPDAISCIKQGIKRYNISIGGTNTDHSGYHETITVFYTRLIINYIMQKWNCTYEEKLHQLLRQSFVEKNFLARYYSKELLMSTTARKTWVEPDKAHLSLA